MSAIARYFTMQKSNPCTPFNFIKCTPKQCVVLRGLRESTKYAVYYVRCIYPVFGFENVDFFCIYFFLGGGC